MTQPFPPVGAPSGTELNAIVIIGGGHAAAQLCAALHADRPGQQVHLVCAERELPYQRPPLSKVFLKGLDQGLQPHRPEAWFTDAGITVHRGETAVAIDRVQRLVRLASGTALAYAQLVLATGTRARQPHGLPEGLDNVALLRSAADAHRLRGLLHAAQHVTVLGGGFIGLEVAATARALGKTVTLVESAPRLLGRSVSGELADHVLQVHRLSGIEIRLGVTVDGFEVDANRLEGWTVDGKREAVELLLVGIGATPEVHLAAEAGLACGNGIEVDSGMRSSDPQILAIGDCTSFTEPRSGTRIRLESVQNANDQAHTAMATLSGRDEPYRALPWFWSEQGAMRLQMAGLLPLSGQRYRRAGAREGSFSILHYADAKLVCAESVNAPIDHMAARALIDKGISFDPALACDPSVPLKSHV